MRYIILILGFFLCLSTFSYAQQTEKGNGSANSVLSEDPQKDLIREFESARHDKPMIHEKEKDKGMLENSQSKSLVNAEYQYEISSYQHRRDVFDWQLTSSKILFWTVIVIVFIGLFFSGLQFYISFKQQNEKQNRSLKPAVSEFMSQK